MIKCKKFIDGECKALQLDFFTDGTNKIPENNMRIINKNDLIENCDGFKDNTKCCWYQPDFTENDLGVYHYDTM